MMNARLKELNSLDATRIINDGSDDMLGLFESSSLDELIERSLFMRLHGPTVWLSIAGVGPRGPATTCPT